MKKAISAIILGFVFTVFIITPTYYAKASEKVTVQQDKKWVETRVRYSLISHPDAPPEKHFYDSGVYRGYISLETYTFDAENKVWIAWYAGYVYTGSVPIWPNTTKDK